VSPIAHGRLDAAERQAVEDHAMTMASDWCRANGWLIVDDVSRRRSWDLEARKRRNGRPMFIEVKGTTGTKLDVEVTDGEVRHARSHPAATVLIIVSGIHLERGARLTAKGGTLHVISPWAPKAAELSPTRYRWRPAGP
jgi:hypothetical protein